MDSGQLTVERKRLRTIKDHFFTHMIFCPGCGCGHGFNVNPERSPCWELSGTEEKPTVRASILVRSGNEKGPTVCHSFITDGQIQYLGDCTHDLAGQTVDLPLF